MPATITGLGGLPLISMDSFHPAFRFFLSLGNREKKPKKQNPQTHSLFFTGGICLMLTFEDDTRAYHSRNVVNDAFLAEVLMRMHE